MLFAATALADDDYSAGMSAFIDGNYELAQAHWLKSAKSQNPRAMFNLGLLHDQKKIANANQEKAERWYRLAGEGGYAAADYRHATQLIATGADKELIRPLLERAASNGYQPAKAKLMAMGGGTASIGTENQAVVLSAKPQAYLDENWILARKGSEWTIQLLAFQDKAKVREFIDAHRLHERAAYFVDDSQPVVLYKLVYGAFKNKEEATQARQNLTPALQEYGPWLRTLAGVQKIIKK